MTQKLPQPFPQSLIESRGTGAGPDFPGSSGDRERGKFRPSATPGLDVIAVTTDDGQPIAGSTNQVLNDVLLYQRAILQALMWMASSNVGEFSVDDVLNEVS